MEIKQISRDLKWIWPYLDSVGDLVPLSSIKKISYYKTREMLGPARHKAIIHRLDNNKNFNIFIRTTLTKDQRIPICSSNQEDILFYLAHELAHVVHWDHDPQHFKLMADIFQRFGRVLKKIHFEEERNKC